ncbi:hypothetical protein C3B44_11255 [Corynebacterium yudongzhengii]|uniref:DUF5318 domain-containing protein n=1 Tax=Corynebacterium yudongzhengii TaxID=2080740 RepID=A0A2U1T4F9_9CORY|nr:DUF5318 family protein [Corynebacterium yudongzhengii]AWB83065.1 hypothetical protein C3B44_11255 [Corynebacterium yudongzhengii]PWC00873.1 hypothetical protein DF222_10505 [Corynebacterium yudongzhengii]
MSLVYRHVVSHRWERARTLRQLKAGHIRREAVCDADFLLRTAAAYHGYRVERACPVCGEEDLYEVRWIYGDKLGKRSGTARQEDEIARIASEVDEPVTVHLVEVCRSCWWNHILTAAVAGIE